MKGQAEQWFWIMFAIIASGILLALFVNFYFGMKDKIMYRTVEESFSSMADTAKIACSSLPGFRLSNEYHFTDKMYAIYASPCDCKPAIDVKYMGGQMTRGDYLCLQEIPVNKKQICIKMPCNISTPYFIQSNITGSFFYQAKKEAGGTPVSTNNVTVVKYSKGVRIFIFKEGTGGFVSLNDIEEGKI